MTEAISLIRPPRVSECPIVEVARMSGRRNRAAIEDGEIQSSMSASGKAGETKSSRYSEPLRLPGPPPAQH